MTLTVKYPRLWFAAQNSMFHQSLNQFVHVFVEPTAYSIYLIQPASLWLVIVKNVVFTLMRSLRMAALSMNTVLMCTWTWMWNMMLLIFGRGCNLSFLVLFLFFVFKVVFSYFIVRKLQYKWTLYNSCEIYTRSLWIWLFLGFPPWENPRTRNSGPIKPSLFPERFELKSLCCKVFTLWSIPCPLRAPNHQFLNNLRFIVDFGGVLRFYIQARMWTQTKLKFWADPLDTQESRLGDP